MINVFLRILQRDLRLAFRRWSELATPLIFFVIIASLFPLASSPDEAQLGDTGSAVLWMSALLSSLLALDGLFRADAEDGCMEQLVLSPAPLGLIVLAKIVAHWVVSGAPLLVLAPLLALSFYLPLEAVPSLIAALALATPTLSVLAAIGAALTVSLRGEVRSSDCWSCRSPAPSSFSGPAPPNWRRTGSRSPARSISWPRWRRWPYRLARYSRPPR